MSTVPIPPILSLLTGHIAAAARPHHLHGTAHWSGGDPRRPRHGRDPGGSGAGGLGCRAAGPRTTGTTDYWLLQRGRWAWLAVWQALLRGLKMLFDPPVWHVV